MCVCDVFLCVTRCFVFFLSLHVLFLTDVSGCFHHHPFPSLDAFCSLTTNTSILYIRRNTVRPLNVRRERRHRLTQIDRHAARVERMAQRRLSHVNGVHAQLVRHVFTPLLDRFQVPEGEREYLVAFYLHGLLAVISQWLRRDCPEDVETLAAFLSRHVPQGG